MPSDAASTPSEAYPETLTQELEPAREEFWPAVVGALDAFLRGCYGIYEFTDDPRCIFRVALGSARHPVRLSDGTSVEIGEPIGSLHFWNEHLPRYALRGPDLGWASQMRRRVQHSLRRLCEYVESEPEWASVRAFCAEATLASRIGLRQIRRLGLRYGFERLDPPRSLLKQVHGFGICVNAWGLTRAFNPAALPRQRLFRDGHELWISRATLSERYGVTRPEPSDQSPRREG